MTLLLVDAEARQCEYCGSAIVRKSTRRSHKWLETARFCSVACKRAMPTRRPLADRFWEKVDRRGPNECWEWQGARGPNGYGRFTVETGTTATASRLAYELTHGPLAPELLARHTCDNPPCCNPAHLVSGDSFANEHDKIDRGRDRKAVGERAHTAKLTEAEVLMIRDECDSGRASQSEMARRFGVRSGTVSLVVRRLTWRHV